MGRSRTPNSVFAGIGYIGVDRPYNTIFLTEIGNQTWRIRMYTSVFSSTSCLSHGIYVTSLLLFLSHGKFLFLLVFLFNIFIDTLFSLQVHMF